MKITIHKNGVKYWRWAVVNNMYCKGKNNTLVYFAFFLIIIRWQ